MYSWEVKTICFPTPQESSVPKLGTLCDFHFPALLHKSCQRETKQTKYKMQQFSAVPSRENGTVGPIAGRDEQEKHQREFCEDR